MHAAKLDAALKQHRDLIYVLLRQYRQLEKRFLLRTDLVEMLEAFCADEPGQALRESEFYRLIQSGQEAFFRDSAMYLDVRRRVGRREFWHVHCEEMVARPISVAEFLRTKERIVDPDRNGAPTLEFDLQRTAFEIKGSGGIAGHAVDHG